MATFVDSAVSILTADGLLRGPVLVHIRRTKAFRTAYPSKKPTAAQKRAQNAFAYVDAHWTKKTRGEKDAWNAWRAWEPNYGYNRYQRLNIPRRLAGLPLIETPPTL